MIHNVSEIMRRVNEDSLSARLRRMRPEIVAALLERGEFKFREGGQEYTIRLGESRGSNGGSNGGK